MHLNTRSSCRAAGYVVSVFGLASALDNGLARTPQMGWNNWNSIGCDVSEGLLLSTSKQLVSLGLRDLGYQYVVLDDCWSGGRDQDGFQFPDMTRFPNGMEFVSDNIHNLGLKFGIYSSAGELTCARYPGSLDWEQNDAQSFASWGVDYLKYDNCYSRGRYGTPEASFKRFETMYSALNRTGRPILYSLCSWGEDYVYFWGASVANSWRVTGDIYDSFSRPDALCACDDPSQSMCTSFGAHCSVLYILNRVAAYADRAQPGAWNDLDMLEVGLGGMTDDEYKAHFTMWALLKSPLLIGADLRTLSPSALTILNNPAIIAINQDPAGRSAYRVHIDYSVKKDKYGVGEIQVWSGPLANGDQVVAFLNAAEEDVDMTCSLEEIFVSDGPGGSAPQVKHDWDVYDLWANRMHNSVAEALRDASLESKLEAAGETLKQTHWYNSTDLPYAEGLRLGDKRLFGKRIGSVKAWGELQARVPRHGVSAFRLRSQTPNLKRYQVRRDEL
ncbi:alpha-galactosidase [Dactylonectria macrodidyma]|uniref:Alpha-galactosidase n=1 Tax=Dactylonectria macrodidyma TaxID=307937 RepID=A0A9P9JD26_9HYPO|nr:alpha-galactosidase [Dactylonectria macrodidyma]